MRRRSRSPLLAVVLAVIVAVVACQGRRSATRDPARRSDAPASSNEQQRTAIFEALGELRREEASLRARTDFATLAPSNRSFGANPYALAVVPETGQLVGILRGDSRVVLLDAGLSERFALPTAPSPSALALGPAGLVFVAGPLARGVERFRIVGERLEPQGRLALPEAIAVRALAADHRNLFAADFVSDKLFSWSMAEASAVPADASRPELRDACGGPIRLALSAHYLAIECLFEHSIVVFSRREDGKPGAVAGRIAHDGPLWSVALLELGDELFVAAGGVEDRPLKRKDRVFGYVDSFVYLYSRRLDALAGADGTFQRRDVTNVSELGVITPKALTLEARDGGPVTFAVGYGSDTAALLVPGRAPTRLLSVPGCADLVSDRGRRLCANPLLDAWVELGARPGVHPVRAARPSDPTARERLGEALFFTNLMAPDASSDGRLSRFTCETCHFEGGTDGRVHHSGRDDIRVSTRPLFGLFNDAPHFSRAHDRDLTSVCHNEFAVANRGNPVDPWFSLEPGRFPWLAELGVAAASLSPLELRRALLAFLARFSHEESPFVARHGASREFTEGERRGAEAFRRRCASCHEPRLVADDAKSSVPFERWELLTLSDETPIVWARGDYAKTGVIPYVEPRGTRIPSLRRLHMKRPYLTNGSAPTLASVLEQVRHSPTQFLHAASDSEALERLDSVERSALLDFLRLL